MGSIARHASKAIENRIDLKMSIKCDMRPLKSNKLFNLIATRIPRAALLVSSIKIQSSICAKCNYHLTVDSPPVVQLNDFVNLFYQQFRHTFVGYCVIRVVSTMCQSLHAQIDDESTRSILIHFRHDYNARCLTWISSHVSAACACSTLNSNEQ